MTLGSERDFTAGILTIAYSTSLYSELCIACLFSEYILCQWSGWPPGYQVISRACLSSQCCNADAEINLDVEFSLGTVSKVFVTVFMVVTALECFLVCVTVVLVLGILISFQGYRGGQRGETGSVISFFFSFFFLSCPHWLMQQISGFFFFVCVCFRNRTILGPAVGFIRWMLIQNTVLMKFWADYNSQCHAFMHTSGSVQIVNKTDILQIILMASYII